MNSRLNSFRAFAMLLLLAFLQPALAQNIGDRRSAGAGIEYTYIGTYSVAELRRIVTTGVDTFMQGSPYPAGNIKAKLRNMPRFPVKLYKVRYPSVVPELDRQPTFATGLLALPDSGATEMPLVSYQHGTVFYKDWVPSSPQKSDETRFMLAVFASQGYAVIAADYFGLGDSNLPNTFFVRRSTVQACADLVVATRKILKQENRSVSHFFVHGWSQGGYNTLAFLRRIEAAGIKVDAASTAAGPTDLRVWIARLMNNPQPGDAPWLVAAASNLIMASDVYIIPGLAERAIRPEYLELARQFYRFELDFLAFYAATPKTIAEYFNPEFLATGKLGETDFWQLMERNENYRWEMSTPLRNYYGEVDEAVPPGIAKMPAQIAGLLGTQTRAISAGPLADHRAAFLFSLTELPDWYRQFMQ